MCCLWIPVVRQGVDCFYSVDLGCSCLARLVPRKHVCVLGLLRVPLTALLDLTHSR